jgi:hypothetical protein
MKKPAQLSLLEELPLLQPRRSRETEAIHQAVIVLRKEKLTVIRAGKFHKINDNLLTTRELISLADHYRKTSRQKGPGSGV